MNRRNSNVFLWLFGIFVLSPFSETALHGDEPAEALGFIEFCFCASPEDTRAFEYYFEQGGRNG